MKSILWCGLFLVVLVWMRRRPRKSITHDYTCPRAAEACTGHDSEDDSMPEDDQQRINRAMEEHRTHYGDDDAAGH